jgi:hypothetical protein
MLIAMLFLFTIGLGLTVYCFIFDINIMECQMESCPLHYFILGFGFYFAFMFHFFKRKGMLK